MVACALTGNISGEATITISNNLVGATRRYGLIRVLDDEGGAVGPWDARLDAEHLRRGLKAMLLTRGFDERMFRAHRQGKPSFYIKSSSEVAIGAA